jgi:hypothetical protein
MVDGRWSTGELVLLREDGQRWRETRRPLPDGGGSVVVRFPPVSLGASAWLLCVFESPLCIVRVGTAGASWANLDPDRHVQVWLPGPLAVPADVPVEVELSDGSGGAERDDD